MTYACTAPDCDHIAHTTLDAIAHCENTGHTLAYEGEDKTVEVSWEGGE